MKRVIHMLLSLVALCAALSTSAYGVSIQDFTRLFPDATREGACFLLRLDDCEVMAASTAASSSASYGEIALVLVSAKQKNTAVRTAKRLASELSPDCTISNFSGSEPSVAIFCPLESVSHNSPLSALLYPISSSKPSIQFVGWKGRMLKARVEYKSSSTYRRKFKGTVEVSVDLTKPRAEYVEYRVVGGRLEEYDIKDFIGDRMWGSGFSLPDFTSKEKSELRSALGAQDILAYNTSSDFCIVSKGKVYRAGTPDGIKEVVSTRGKSLAAHLKYPEQSSSWPGERPKENDQDDKKTAIAANTPAPPADNKPAEAAPAPPSEKVDIVITGENMLPLPNLPPAEALKTYMQSLKSM